MCVREAIATCGVGVVRGGKQITLATSNEDVEDVNRIIKK